MKTRTESIRGARAFSFIKEKKRIHKFELMSFLGLSISSYEKFKPWFEFSYGKQIDEETRNRYGCVQYEKEIQEWVFCPPTEQTIEETEDK